MEKRERNWLPRGSQHHNAKLTEEDVKLIIELGEERLRLKAELEKVKQSAVAEKFGVVASVISRIQNAHDWRHV